MGCYRSRQNLQIYQTFNSPANRISSGSYLGCMYCFLCVFIYGFITCLWGISTDFTISLIFDLRYRDCVNLHKSKCATIVDKNVIQ